MSCEYEPTFDTFDSSFDPSFDSSVESLRESRSHGGKKKNSHSTVDSESATAWSSKWSSLLDGTRAEPLMESWEEVPSYQIKGEIEPYKWEETFDGTQSSGPSTPHPSANSANVSGVSQSESQMQATAFINAAPVLTSVKNAPMSSSRSRHHSKKALYYPTKWSEWDWDVDQLDWKRYRLTAPGRTCDYSNNNSLTALL